MSVLIPSSWAQIRLIPLYTPKPTTPPPPHPTPCPRRGSWFAWCVYMYIRIFRNPLGCPWLALGALGSLWVPLDSLWVPLGCPLAPFGLQGGQKRSSTVKINKNAVFGTRHRSRRSHGNHRKPAKWCQELWQSPPPTRAGSQEDGSYTNSLK